MQCNIKLRQSDYNVNDQKLDIHEIARGLSFFAFCIDDLNLHKDIVDINSINAFHLTCMKKRLRCFMIDNV